MMFLVRILSTYNKKIKTKNLKRKDITSDEKTKSMEDTDTELSVNSDLDKRIKTEIVVKQEVNEHIKVRFGEVVLTSSD